MRLKTDIGPIVAITLLSKKDSTRGCDEEAFPFPVYVGFLSSGSMYIF